MYCESQTSWEFILLGSEKDKLKDFQGAILDYDQAIKISPDSCLAYLFRALSKQQIYDNTGAIDDYSKFIDISPKNENEDAYYFRGTVKHLIKDYQGL